VLAVGHERRAVQSPAAIEAHACRDRVAGDPDRSGQAEREQAAGRERVDDPEDREHRGGDCTGQNRQHDGEAGATLGTVRTQ
jgi:hypothetical protein